MLTVRIHYLLDRFVPHLSVLVMCLFWGSDVEVKKSGAVDPLPPTGATLPFTFTSFGVHALRGVWVYIF
jgi:hypothetical protein